MLLLTMILGILIGAPWWYWVIWIFVALGSV